MCVQAKGWQNSLFRLAAVSNQRLMAIYCQPVLILLSAIKFAGKNSLNEITCHTPTPRMYTVCMQKLFFVHGAGGDGISAVPSLSHWSFQGNAKAIAPGKVF